MSPRVTPETFAAELIVEPFLSGKRIDTFLSRHFRNYSSFRMQRIVRAGEVRINDVPADNDSRVYRGQHVTVRLIEPPDKLLPPTAGPLDVLFDDPWLLVVNKPAGQIAHPAGDYATNSLANTIQHYLDHQTKCRGLLRPGIVHRLDRLTSGLMVVSKEHLSHALLTESFMRRRVYKRYLALVHGRIESLRGVLDKPIGASKDSESCLRCAGPDAVEPQEARTEFRVVERFAEHTWVEARPITGRHHQIRVHFADHGHPVVDDEFYGSLGWIKKARDGTLTPEPIRTLNSENSGHVKDSKTPPFPRGRPDCGEDDGDGDRSDLGVTEVDGIVGRQALHAWRLAFRHPITWEPLNFEAPLPHDIARAVERLRGAQAAEVRCQAVKNVA